MGARRAPLRCSQRQANAIELLTAAFEKAPQHVDEIMWACTVLGVEWRAVLDELDARRPLYVYGSIVGFRNG